MDWLRRCWIEERYAQAHIPAKEEAAPARSWLPRSYGYENRAQSLENAAAQGPPAHDCGGFSELDLSCIAASGSQVRLTFAGRWTMAEPSKIIA